MSVTMTDQASSMSSVKLGLSIAWPAFWTGVPIKLVIALLFLAMGLHPWEGVGLAFLLLLSIPIDIWALNLCAKTVFLERLRLDPPENLGLTLWWQGAILTLVYGYVAWLLLGVVVEGAKAVAAKIVALPEHLPVAEKISIELTLWSSVAGVVLLLLVLGWLFLFGRIVKRAAAAGVPASAAFPALIRRWDLMRIPADQTLTLTILVGTGVVLVFFFWGFLPVTTPHPHEDFRKEAKVEGPIKPVEVLENTESVIVRAEAALEELEKEDKKGGKKKGAGKEKAKVKGTESQPAKTQAAQPQPVKQQPGGAKAQEHAPSADHTH